MDLSETTAPDSTQINAEDFFGGPKTLTIAGVSKGSAEQPVNIELVEISDRVYRPSKSMRRVLVNAWGPDSSAYVGRSMTLYRDPDVTFGRDKVGGIKISHLSHIDKRVTVALTVARGRRAPFSVEPLAAPSNLISDQQMKKLHIVLKETGYTDRESALEKLSEITGREVASSKDLTRTEAGTVIDHLTALAGME